MSKIKNGGLDQYGLNPSNSSNLEYLALKGLMISVMIDLPVINSELIVTCN